MNKKPLIIPLPFLFLFPFLFALLPGCSGSPERETLKRAEKMIEAHPDSARILLEGINPSTLKRADLSLYALLDAQARHKLYLPAPSDSMLNIAADYYTSHGPDSLLMKTLFYRAVGYKSAGDLISATNDATTAWDLSSATKTYYWRAKTAELIGDIYHADSNMTEESRWRKRASEDYRRAGRFDNHLFSLCDLIVALTDMGETKKALALVDSLRPIVDAHPEIPQLSHYFYLDAVPVYAHFGDLKTATILLDSLNLKYEGGLPSPLPVYQAEIKIRQGDYAEAREIIKAGLPRASNANDSILFLHKYAKSFSKEGDSKKGYEYLDSVLDLQYSAFHKTLGHSITTAQRDLYENKFSSETKRADRQRSYTTFLVILLLLICVTVTVILHIIRRNAKRKLQLDLEEIYDLREEMMRERVISAQVNEERATELASAKDNLVNVQAELTDIRSKLELQRETQETLYRQKWELLNKLCFELNPDKKSVNENERITANLRKYIESLRDMEHFKEIEDSINLYMNGVMKRMRAQCDFLSEKDFIFLALLYAGHSAKTIAFFTGIRLSYFYTKRDRLYLRILKSDAPDKEEFTRRIKET
ncbi:MAG: hypothetical protein K2K81_03140 [Muribaculaceae bacterium]|nr:hypothetical protein [Muribaculaceae bacterium]